jgi:hypothetical protein
MRNLIAFLIMIAIAMPAVAQAQQCRFLAMADELKLTDQQIEQLNSSLNAHRKEMVQYRANLQKAKIELNELMLAKKIDRQAALKKSSDISLIKSDMAKKALEYKIDRLNMLDDKQQNMVRQKMMLHGPGMGKPHRGDRDGRGQRNKPDRGPNMKMGQGGGYGWWNDADMAVDEDD